MKSLNRFNSNHIHCKLDESLWLTLFVHSSRCWVIPRGAMMLSPLESELDDLHHINCTAQDDPLSSAIPSGIPYALFHTIYFSTLHIWRAHELRRAPTPPRNPMRFHWKVGKAPITRASEADFQIQYSSTVFLLPVLPYASIRRRSHFSSLSRPSLAHQSPLPTANTKISNKAALSFPSADSDDQFILTPNVSFD